MTNWLEPTPVLSPRGWSVTPKEVFLFDKFGFFKKTCKAHTSLAKGFTSKEFEFNHRGRPFSVLSSTEVIDNSDVNIDILPISNKISSAASTGILNYGLKNASTSDLFRIAYQADGDTRLRRNKGKYRSTFKMKKERKVFRAEALFSKYLDTKKYSKKTGYTRMTFVTDFKPEKTLSWIDLPNTSLQQRREMIHEILQWDGSTKVSPPAYTTTSLECAHTLQALCALSGYTTGISYNNHGIRRKDLNGKMVYIVRVMMDRIGVDLTQTKVTEKEVKAKVCSVDGDLFVMALLGNSPMLIR